MINAVSPRPSGRGEARSLLLDVLVGELVMTTPPPVNWTLVTVAILIALILGAALQQAGVSLAVARATNEPEPKFVTSLTIGLANDRTKPVVLKGTTAVTAPLLRFFSNMMKRQPAEIRKIASQLVNFQISQKAKRSSFRSFIVTETATNFFGVIQDLSAKHFIRSNGWHRV